MNEEQEAFISKYEDEIRKKQLEVDSERLGRTQQEVYMQDQERGLASEQLSVDEILENIHYLLKGYILKPDEQGIMNWTAPLDNEMIILSEHGINYMMGAVQWYLNKNTLLSNYKDEQINTKMEDLATTLCDDIFMEYDKMFNYPTDKECYDEIKKRIQAKVDLRKFAMELMGKVANEKKIREDILEQMEDRILQEIETIRQQKMKNKLKRFESLIRFIQDTIHSAYNRAYMGQERTTLRQHFNISETKGMNFPQPQSSGIFKFGQGRR